MAKIIRNGHSLAINNHFFGHSHKIHVSKKAVLSLIAAILRSARKKTPNHPDNFCPHFKKQATLSSTLSVDINRSDSRETHSSASSGFPNLVQTKAWQTRDECVKLDVDRDRTLLARPCIVHVCNFTALNPVKTTPSGKICLFADEAWLWGTVLF